MKRFMKIQSAVLLALFAASVVHGASDNDTDSAFKPLQVYPKNLARQHLGANMLVFNESKQAYVPTEAAAAWLDDDVATGWPAMTGKQHYLVALAEPQLLTNFCISERTAKGTISIYAGDEAASPGAKSWALLAKDVNVDSINQKLMDHAFSRFAKYLLIETNLSESGPWYSVYIYGEKPAVAYHLQQRAQPVDPRALFGPYSNPQTAFSLSSLYAHSRVAFVNTADNATAWQKVIDDNPETEASIAPSKDQPGLVIRYDSQRSIQRISVLADGTPKGKLEFFLLNENAAKPAQTASNDSSQYIKASNVIAAIPNNAPTMPTTSDSLSNAKPVATISFDGSSQRGSADFTPASGSQLVARWTPETAGQPLAVREVNSFSDLALNDHELAPDSVGEDLAVDSSKDGKDMGGKEELPPVGEVLPPKTPFIPGLPPFPPNVPFSPR